MGIHDYTIALVYGTPYKGCIEEECHENVIDLTWMSFKAHSSDGYVIACDYDLIKYAPSEEPWSIQQIVTETASVPQDALERMKHWARKHGLPEPTWYMALDMDCDVRNSCKHRED
jgi:hypothetical protein